MSSDRPRVAFVLEEALGHATHAQNLTRLISPDDRIRAVFAPIAFDPHPRWSRVPGHGNWTVRAGIRARRAVRRLHADGPVDAMFVHTQVPATLMPDRVARTPTIISLDATPAQYDELADVYGHTVGNAHVERLKMRVQRASFQRATALVTWSAWAKAGLVEHYGVDPDKVTVIPPGVDRERWETESGTTRQLQDRPVRVLFVGGDFVRKGGDVLVDAVRRLRWGGVAIDLDIVTHADVPGEPGITVHHGLTANSPALMKRFSEADIFCLPSRGDCLPSVLAEAGAMALPLVATHVGGMSEIVRPNRTGLLVPPDDAPALATTLRELVEDRGKRERLGLAAKTLVRERFDAATNASRLVELLLSVARRPDD